MLEAVADEEDCADEDADVAAAVGVLADDAAVLLPVLLVVLAADVLEVLLHAPAVSAVPSTATSTAVLDRLRNAIVPAFLRGAESRGRCWRPSALSRFRRPPSHLLDQTTTFATDAVAADRPVTRVPPPRAVQLEHRSASACG